MVVINLHIKYIHFINVKAIISLSKSNMLGHKDSSMTLEVYAKYIKQTDKVRAKLLSK